MRGLRPKIAGIPGVEEVQFISRDEALRSLERQMGEGSNLRESLGGENPFPMPIRYGRGNPSRSALSPLP